MVVVCKYFQQGTCRYGQYCRFQHINNFGANQGNSNKQFVEGKNIVLGVAEEVLVAERGGQWLLSCFGPLKEQPCIPGMDDVSPEEVRWEMYQAQKNGTVDRTKLQFQQLCQTMTVKREALKNPTHETAAMLEKLQKSNRDGTFGGKANFALSNPQMAQSPNATTASNVFGQKSFGATTNPFVGGFNPPGATTSSIFGCTSTSNTSVFGAKPSFGGTSVFGGQTNNNSVFGGGNNKTGSTGPFGANQNSMQTFATANSTSNSVFGGGTAQPVFAQSTTFGSTSQANSPFSMAQSGQSTTSVFGTTTAANNPFGNSSASLFGTASNSTGLFGNSSNVQSGNSIFGGSTGTPANSTIGSTSIFVQPKNTAAFGGAPVFGTTGTFGNTQGGGSRFGGQASFENPTLSGNNVFGNTSTQSTTFGANAQTTNNFGALVAPNTTPFGAPVPTTSNTPFGAQNGPFGTAATSPFARNPTFGGSMQSPDSGSTFGGTIPSGDSPFVSQTAASAFGTVVPSVSQTFGTSAFGNAPSTPFASTTSTATTSNPFAPRSQQQINSPFGIAATTTSSGGPFGQSNYGSITTASIIDETAYTPEERLTDDEKSLYLWEQFVLGKIPLKPPTIELR